MNAVNKIFICLAIIFVPFIGSVSGPALLGSMGRSLSYYPLLAVAMIFLIVGMKNGHIIIPNTKSFAFLLAFMAWILLSGIMNVDAIVTNTYQGVAGLSRYGSQWLAIVVDIIIAVAIYAYLSKMRIGMVILHNCLFYSALLAGAYSLLEVVTFVNPQPVLTIQALLRDTFDLTKHIGSFVGRVHSVAAESSYFGMYAGIVFPFLLTKKTKHWLLIALFNVYFVLLVALSFSRTAYMILAVEMLLFAILYRERIWKYKQKIIGGALVSICFILTVQFYMTNDSYFNLPGILTSLYEDNEVYNPSNLARFGSKDAALAMGLENIFFGVGFGQYGFYAAEYYPASALNSVEVAAWSLNVVGGSWPPVHNLYARIFAELGLGGLLLWVGFLISLGYEQYRACKNTYTQEDNANKCLLITMVGLFLCGFNVDNFQLIPLWLLIPFIWKNKDCVK